MLTYEECLAMCDLSEQEIAAIAEHEHMDPIIAMALGHHLVTHDGEQQIHRFIVDDIEHARHCGNRQHEQDLRSALSQFISNHPQCRGMRAA